MILWIDAQLSPALGRWLQERFGLDSTSVRDLGLRDADDQEIWRCAGAAGAVVMTKDRDFVLMVEKHGPPPQVLWVTCGNTSNRYLKRLLEITLPAALILLRDGEPLVEIADASGT